MITYLSLFALLAKIFDKVIRILDMRSRNNVTQMSKTIYLPTLKVSILNTEVEKEKS